MGKMWVNSLLLALSLLLVSEWAWAREENKAALKEGILLAAFGTSVTEARADLHAVEKAFRSRFPDASFALTYTSQIIRKKLAKEGEHIPGISEALSHLAQEGARIVRIQPLHVMQGEEYSELERALLLDVKKHPQRFQHVYLGRPLMESSEDARIVAEALVARCAEKRKNGEALVLMGHGQEKGRAGLVFEGVRAVFAERDPRIFMATVEGQRDFEMLLQDLKKHEIKSVLLRPLMLVAGDHARNDLGGSEEDSWASMLRKEGFLVNVDLEGLGNVPEVEALYIRHALESRDDLTNEPRKK